MHKARPQLIFLSGERANERFPLHEGSRYILGRDSTADITLPEKKISRRHACLWWDGATHRLQIEDLQSLNGTYVNGELIREPKTLYDKDRIQIGSFLLQISAPDHEPSIVELSAPMVSQAKENTSQSFPAASAKTRVTDPSMPPQKISKVKEIRDLEAETGGRMIAGKLEDLPLSDLLQMFANTKKSGRLIISKQKVTKAYAQDSTPDGQWASLYLQDGELIYACYKDKINEDAFFSILRAKSGFFAMYPITELSVGPLMEMPIEALLLEGFRRLDESNAENRPLKPDDEFEVRLEESLTALEPNELQVFQIVWKAKNLANTWTLSPFDKEATDHIIRQLIKRGFLRPKED